MGAGVRDAFPPPMCVYGLFTHFVWVDCAWRLIPFGQIECGRLVAFGWIAFKWLFGLCGIAWKNMMEIGRGGAYVPARVAPQGRIHR